MARRQIISTAHVPRTGLPYSQAVRHGDLVFVAGQLGIGPATGQMVEGGIQAETRQVLDNVQTILGAAGTSLAHAVETMCFLRDLGDFRAFNEAYQAYFPEAPPSRTTVQAVLPHPSALVEIRVVAAMPASRRGGRARAPAARAARTLKAGRTAARGRRATGGR